MIKEDFMVVFAKICDYCDPLDAVLMTDSIIDHYIPESESLAVNRYRSHIVEMRDKVFMDKHGMLPSSFIEQHHDTLSREISMYVGLGGVDSTPID